MIKPMSRTDRLALYGEMFFLIGEAMLLIAIIGILGYIFAVFVPGT